MTGDNAHAPGRQNGPADDERALFAELTVQREDVEVPVGIAAMLWDKIVSVDNLDSEDHFEPSAKPSAALVTRSRPAHNISNGFDTIQIGTDMSNIFVIKYPAGLPDR
jgi:hypothetical protein